MKHVLWKHDYSQRVFSPLDPATVTLTTDARTVDDRRHEPHHCHLVRGEGRLAEISFLAPRVVDLLLRHARKSKTAAAAVERVIADEVSLASIPMLNAVVACLLEVMQRGTAAEGADGSHLKALYSALSAVMTRCCRASVELRAVVILLLQVGKERVFYILNLFRCPAALASSYLRVFRADFDAAFGEARVREVLVLLVCNEGGLEHEHAVKERLRHCAYPLHPPRGGPRVLHEPRVLLV